MKKTILMSLLGLAMSGVFVSGILAQEKPAQAPVATTQETKLEKFSGIIESIDSAKKDVLVQMHKEKMTFSVGNGTKIYEGKKELSFSDLKDRLWASVEFKKEGNQLLAQVIRVSPPKETKAVAPSEKTTEKQVTPTEKAPEKM
jgi:hypothetical protein